MILIGIDLGTTGCKGMAFGADGTILSDLYYEYDLIHTEEGWILQDADQWWQLVQRLLKETAAALGPAAADIQGIGISSQGISVVPVDAEGNALDLSINWLDKRAVKQAEQLTELFGKKEIFTRTGKMIGPGYTLGKLMWYKQNRPELYARTVKFLLPLDFINMKLTGNILTDYAMASGTMTFNVNSGSWDEEILEGTGIDIAKMPPVAVAGSLVGSIKPDLAATLGLPETTKVYLGTQDQKSAALAAGVGSNIATVSLGTASAISTISDQPQNDTKMRIPFFALGNKRWVQESVIGTASVTLKWLREMIAADLSYAQMDDLAEEAAPGSGGVFFYPHMQGAGTPFGRRIRGGSFQGLSLATDKKDLIRALLEGIAFQMEYNLKVQEEVNQTPITQLRIFGGGSKSDLWCSIIADVTGRTVWQMQPELANFGAAMLADAGGKGQHFAQVRQPLRIYEPDKERAAKYKDIYKEYRRVEEKIMD